VCVAESQKARNTLNWEPRFADLAAMIAHAWSWEQQKGKTW
jgi:UDP-glucose 4-epimerase